jgi:peptidoglycan/xylan/chitin deacetylase (PgdA/CDA1 family)
LRDRGGRVHRAFFRPVDVGNGSCVILTFDDGPDAVWTPRVLDVLAAAGARATFFPIAPRAAAHPDLVERMRTEGHEVGLHCDEHVRHSMRSEAWLIADTECALERLAGLGVAPTRWRPPWGDTAPFTREVADAHGLTLTEWTVDTHDWRGDSAAMMFDATRDGLVEEAIVLAHDGIGPGARRADARETVAYTARVVDFARETGLTLEALP